MQRYKLLNINDYKGYIYLILYFSTDEFLTLSQHFQSNELKFKNNIYKTYLTYILAMSEKPFTLEAERSDDVSAMTAKSKAFEKTDAIENDATIVVNTK